MNTLVFRPWSVVVAGVAIGLLAGCAPADASVDAPTMARPQALADYPSMTLVAPAAADAGTSPTFAWQAVPDAADYRLSVVAADGPVWAWSGTATEVVFGGYEAAPATGVGALRLTRAAWWSVAAYAADGALLAVSDLRAVSPDATMPAPLAAAPPGEAAPQPAPLDSACPLYSDAEAEEFLEGELAGPGRGGVEADGATLSCSWVRADDEFLTLDISVKPGVSRASWDESMEAMLEFDPDLTHGLDGLGDDSYVDAGWSGTRLALIDGDVYLSVRSGFTDGAEDVTIEAAQLILERYRERAQ